MDPLSWGLGVLLGAVCTLVRYGMMEHSLKQTLQKENGSRAAQYALVQFLLRELLFCRCVCVGGLCSLDPSSRRRIGDHWVIGCEQVAELGRQAAGESGQELKDGSAFLALLSLCLVHFYLLEQKRNHISQE